MACHQLIQDLKGDMISFSEIQPARQTTIKICETREISDLTIAPLTIRTPYSFKFFIQMTRHCFILH